MGRPQGKQIPRPLRGLVMTAWKGIDPTLSQKTGKDGAPALIFRPCQDGVVDERKPPLKAKRGP